MPKQRSDMTPEEQMATPEEGAEEAGGLHGMDEGQIQARATDKQRNYEDSTGTSVPEEPGIQPDEITMGAVDALSGAGPVRAIAGHGMAYVANKVKQDAKERLAHTAEDSALLKGRKLFGDNIPAQESTPSIGGMGMSSPPPPSGAGMGDSSYRKMTPFTKTDATNGWQPSPGIRIQDKTKSAIRPWTPGGK